jgi:hypothetical protein
MTSIVCIVVILGFRFVLHVVADCLAWVLLVVDWNDIYCLCCNLSLLVELFIFTPHPCDSALVGLAVAKTHAQQLILFSDSNLLYFKVRLEPWVDLHL